VQAHLTNRTYRLTRLPRGAKLAKADFVFTLKRDAAGNIVRYKARWVAKGYSMMKGVDYHETWAPVPSMATVRMLFAVAAARDLEIHQLDVRTAYLNADIDTELYLEKPKGFEKGGPEMVFRVLRAIYGTKQAGRLWWQHFGATLAGFGARRSSADPCLYTYETSHGIVCLLIWVDDVLIFCRAMAGIKETKGLISAAYDVQDLGEVKDFVGVRVVRSRRDRRIELSNPGHTAALLSAHHLIDANPTKAPMLPGTPLGRTGVNLLPDKTPYLELVGSLLYLSTTTRPDIALAVGILARFMHEPEDTHWRAARMVLRYLSGTATHGLTYIGGGPVTGFVDADYAGDPESRRSTTGWVFLTNGAPISWQSRRQPSVSTSTAEAECIAAAAATKEALWLRKLLADVGEPVNSIRIAEDNTAYLSIINNPEGVGRAKHVDISHHMVRERVLRGEVTFFHLPTADMVADGLTKPLPVPAFTAFRDRLGVTSGMTNRERHSTTVLPAAPTGPLDPVRRWRGVRGRGHGNTVSHVAGWTDGPATVGEC